jgi:trimethylamine--corrinoid protein Co-methyltransferase
MIQLAHPGAPAFYSIVPGIINPHTGGYVAGLAPKCLLTPATVQLGHYYNLPVLSGGFGDSDAHHPADYEAGLEFLMAFPAVFAGADIVSGMGLLEASTLLYPEKILFDNEIFNTVKTFSQGIEVNQSTLALDEIMEVGPRGQFLTQPSTKDNLRKLWNPGITHQWSKEEGDFKDPQQVAIEKIEWILANHKPKPLEEDKAQELDRIIETAEKELG